MSTFTSAQDVATFARAGRAILTVTSTGTGARYTYKFSAPKDDAASPRRFVSLLTGPDNGDDYSYIGCMEGTAFRTTKASRLTDAAPPVRAVRYLCERVLSHPEAPLPAGIEIRHEGRCGCCGRRLTVPESIDRGIGPECAERMGMV
jgi:hypothetical protein